MIDVIPAPLQVTNETGRFLLVSGARVGWSDWTLAATVEHFARNITRRTGIPIAAVGPLRAGDVPQILVEVGADADLDALPIPLGVSPLGDVLPDERYSLNIHPDRIIVRGIEAVGAARGLTTLLQLIAITPTDLNGAIALPALRLLDAPRFAWRGFSVDLARTFFPVHGIRRVIDLVALYKLNVLTLHLTDDDGWRIEAGRPAERRHLDGTFYTNEELRELVRYAEERYVTLIPEIDTPGHANALIRFRPELRSHRNALSFEIEPGVSHRAAWLDPALPATFAVIQEVLADVTACFSSPYVHIGGDEPFGMPEPLYVDYMRRLRTFVRTLGKRTMGWQESIRAGADPDHVIQYWISPPRTTTDLPPAVVAHVARSRQDIAAALAHGVPVIVSPVSNAYFDVPYAEHSVDPAQEELRRRVGMRFYAPKTVAQTFDWEPANALGPEATIEAIGGVAATVWAESIHSFDELMFLLLPRLPGIAEKAWSSPRTARWAEHRERLASHGRLWTEDGLTYFQSSAVNWKRAA